MLDTGRRGRPWLMGCVFESSLVVIPNVAVLPSRVEASPSFMLPFFTYHGASNSHTNPAFIASSSSGQRTNLVGAPSYS